MTPLRIGFAGNQNNSPFMLARALRAAGHDVRFLIDRPEPLNRPEFRYADIRYPYPSWIEEIPTFEVDDVVYRTAAWRTLLDRLSDCDVVVLNSMAFAAAADLAMPAICQVTGSDLEFYCDRTRGERYALFQDYKGRTRHWRNAVMTMPPPSVEALRHIANGLPSPLFHYYRAHMFRRAADRHMAGLRASRAVICLPTGAVPLSDRLLDAALTVGESVGEQAHGSLAGGRVALYAARQRAHRGAPGRERPCGRIHSRDRRTTRPRRHRALAPRNAAIGINRAL